MNTKHLYTSLSSGATSGSVTDDTIINDSVIEIYFDNPDCYIDSSSQNGHTVYFTVGGNVGGTNVCVVVNNLTDFTPYDYTGLVSRVGTLESEVDTIDNLVTTLETDVETLETKVNGLNANNINYDEHSTLYSAMGDIDSLQTTSKNLVGAINEVKQSGGGGGSDDYTLQETVIGTWLGKPLYRIVVTGTGGGTSGSMIMSGSSFVGIVTNVYGYYTESTGHYFALTYRGGSPAVWSDVQVWNGGNVWFYSSKSNVTYTIVIEYTKKTD